MSLLVFGKTGQVARALSRAAPGARFLDRRQADLSRPGACLAAISRLAPTAVINAAAFTDVDGAESAAQTAHQVNAVAPAEMAQGCLRLGIPFLHISTDFVFDGSGDWSWTPSDRPAPLGVYGRSKLAGEQAIDAIGARAVILRSSWIFSDGPGNFRTGIRDAARMHGRLRVVADQIGGPTHADDLARACLTILFRLSDDAGLAGTYHYAGGPDVSRAAFARAILGADGIDCAVEDIASSDWQAPAARPLNSRLCMARTTAAFGLARPGWADRLMPYPALETAHA